MTVGPCCFTETVKLKEINCDHHVAELDHQVHTCFGFAWISATDVTGMMVSGFRSMNDRCLLYSPPKSCSSACLTWSEHELMEGSESWGRYAPCPHSGISSSPGSIDMHFPRTAFKIACKLVCKSQGEDVRWRCAQLKLWMPVSIRGRDTSVCIRWSLCTTLS